LTGCSLFQDGHATVSPTESTIKTNANPDGKDEKSSKHGISTNSNGIAAMDKEENAPLLVNLTDAQEKEVGLVMAQAKQGFVLKTVESPGRVGPNAELSRLVSTPSAGRAIEVKARLGDIVAEGQVMAIIKSDPIGQIQSDLLQATLQSKADIQQQQVQLKLSHITFDRETKLFGEQVSAKADLQAAENQLEKDESNLTSLKAKLAATILVAQERLTLLGAPPDSAKKVISQGKIDPYVIIRAPEGGLVIERTINPGEMNDGTKQLFTITDLSQVWLFADIFEKDIRDINKGDAAAVTIDSLPGKKFPARIIWVGDSISTTTRTLPVRATVSNANRFLRPGMFARIVIDAARIPVLLVPRTSLIQKGDKTFVFVEKRPGVFEQRDVETGIDGDNGVQITSGLKAGDRIVAQGGTSLLGTALKASEGN
jgi:cobalt-zinc-cadmium efflux system membrane fusion protein